MIIHSNFNDFILFLYVHLSNADSSYDPAELATIKQQMRSLYPDTVDFEKKLYLAIREYNAFDKAKLPELFEASALHFKNEKPKPQIAEAFHAIVSADGTIDQREAKAMAMLKQIIKN